MSKAIFTHYSPFTHWLKIGSSILDIAIIGKHMLDSKHIALNL